MERREAAGWSYGLLSCCRGELMGLAMLWIMLFHAFNLTRRLTVVNVIRATGFLGVDVFIFLSAMGLSMSLSRRKQSLGEFYFRRFVRVLPTYWLVTVCYGLLLRLAGRASLTSIFWTVSTLFFWLGKPNYFNWYIPALLAFYLLTPLWYNMLKRCPYREVVTAILSLGGFVLARAVVDAGYVELSDFFYRIPIFLLGILVGLYISEGRELTMPALCFRVAGLPLAVILFLLPKGGWFRVSMCLLFFLAFAGCALALSRGLLFLPEKGVRGLLRLVGESSLEIYLLNVVFVREYDLLSRFLSFDPYQIVYYAMTIPLNVALGVLLHRVLEKPLKGLAGRLGRTLQRQA